MNIKMKLGEFLISIHFNSILSISISIIDTAVIYTIVTISSKINSAKLDDIKIINTFVLINGKTLPNIPIQILDSKTFLAVSGNTLS